MLADRTGKQGEVQDKLTVSALIFFLSVTLVPKTGASLGFKLIKGRVSTARVKQELRQPNETAYR